MVYYCVLNIYIDIDIMWSNEALKNKCTCPNRVCVLHTSKTHVSQKIISKK